MSTLYGIVDAAQDVRVFDLVRSTSHQECLYAGDLAPEVARAAPYIVNLDRASALSEAWNTEGLGRNWGIRCFSDRSLLAMRRHFRHFLRAKLPDGSVALFRFYDPRIWSVYLPTCDYIDLERWFENVEEYVTETVEGDELVFFLNGGKLRSKRRPSSSTSSRTLLGADF